MFLKVHAIFSLGYVLVSLAPLLAAKPISLDLPHTINQRGQNATLAASGPWGPDEFQVFAVHRTTPIRRDAAFMTAVSLLAQQTRFDFNSRLSRAQIIFRDPSFSPRLSIAVSASKPDQRVLRCHIFWGIAQILNRMVQGHAFMGSIWRLNLGGQEVGTIFFIAGTAMTLEPGSKVLDSARSQPLTLGPIATPTAISAGTGVHIAREFWGNLMTTENVFMSAVAALIALAEQPDRTTFDVFIASYPGYPAFQVWHSTQAEMQQPSLITKPLLVLSVALCVKYALEKNNWHALRAEVRAHGSGGLLIAMGGYADSLEPTGTQGLSSS
ncbi:MAG: hypothetical protein Q9199_001488 [Rusavskia elegans]